MAHSPRNGNGVPRTSFARTDITTPAAGLFRVAEKGRPRLEATEVSVEHDGVVVTYVTPYRLGAEEWRVLLAIAALAGLDGDRFRRSSEPSLWDQFLTSGVAADRDALHLRTTAYALLREVGLEDSGQNRRALSGYLDRLSTVSQTLRKGGKTMSGARLIAYAHDEDSGELGVGVSPQMARAILGESKQFVRISMAEVRRLPLAAVLLQALFSSRLRPGQSASYRLDQLVDVVYGTEKVAASVMRKRRERTRKALLAFNEYTTWQIGFEEVRDRRGTAAWMVNVHRVDKAVMAAWEAEVTASEMVPSDAALVHPYDD